MSPILLCKEMLNFRRSSVAGDTRLTQNEPIKKDKISKSYEVRGPRSTSILKKRRRQMNGRNNGIVRPLCPQFSERYTQMKCISYCKHAQKDIPSTPSNATYTGQSLPVGVEPLVPHPLKLRASASLSSRNENRSKEIECNFNVVRWAMWWKKVIGILVMPSRERVLRLDE